MQTHLNKPHLLLILTLILGIGCQEEEIPYQLSDEQFIRVITDLHISESATQHLALHQRDSMAVIYLQQILDIHSVKNELFEAEYERLKNDPKKLVKIYEKVIERLTELKLKKPEGSEQDKKK